MIAKLREAYLDFTIAATDFAEHVSQEVFGREVPQTLLLHVNDINTDCLDEMLKRFKVRGYRFVTLDEAMEDSAYQTKDTLVTNYGPMWFVRWAKSKRMKVSFEGAPDPPQWVMDMYRHR